MSDAWKNPEACLKRGQRLNHLIENFKPLQLAGMICDLECQLQKANERKKLWHLIAHAFQDDNFKPVFEHLQTMTFEDSK